MNTKFVELENLEQKLEQLINQNSNTRKESEKKIKNIIHSRFDALYNELKQEIYAKENSIVSFTGELDKAVKDIKENISQVDNERKENY